MQGMSIATKIDFPIKIKIGEIEEIVGQFYASIGRDLDSISIQLYISNKTLASENMTLVQNAYAEFYQSILTEAISAGYTFMKQVDNEVINKVN